MTFRERIAAAPPSSFHVLDPAKARRLKGATMVIPSVDDVLAAVREIPLGDRRTIGQIKSTLAQRANADIACPYTTNLYWKWLASAAEYEGGDELPWWRVTVDGRPSRHMPGGEAEHAARLAAER